MIFNSHLLSEIQAAVYLYRARTGHDPEAILLEREAYNEVKAVARDAFWVMCEDGKAKRVATEALFGIPVKRVSCPGYGFYLSERYGAAGVGGAKNAAD